MASHRLAALALGLWALNSATYPVLGSIEAFKPMGLALSALLQIGTGIGLLLSHLDLASEALDRAAVRYRALIEHASVGVFQADSEGRLIVANPELAHILGHKDLDTLRLQAVGRLTGGIAHDFNNLLTVIIGNLELARSTGQASRIEDALEASDRASKLTRQLLTFARSQESEAETVDLVPQVTVLSRLLSRTLPECLTLTVDHEAPSCIAAIPASDLDQIVLNLVVNARDALGADQGRIRVSTRMEETEGDRFAILLVADNGPGLDPSVRDSLFEPFVSTRDGDGGLGLGLSIVRNLVSRAGGRIDVRSDPVDGTCFEVRLPVTAPTGPAPALSDPPVEGDGTILVVDDDPAVRRTVTRILEDAGFRVIEASGLGEAQAALDPSLRAIITDVVMQDGSGFDVLETVEQRGLAVPCILISGYPDQVTRHQGNVHASVPILSKPFRAQELLALLRERLHARQAQPSSHRR